MIQAQNLTKIYKSPASQIVVFEDLNFEVQAGSLFAIIGPSGSGKTTLLHLLGGLDRPTRGTLRIAGQETNNLTEGQFAALRHSKIGFIFQSFNLIPFLSA